MRRSGWPLAQDGCAATCTAYAAALSSQRGRKFTLDHTWATVIAGVSIVLAWLSTQGTHSVLVDFAFFAAGGAPLVARSFWLYWRNQRQYVSYLRDTRQDGQ